MRKKEPQTFGVENALIEVSNLLSNHFEVLACREASCLYEKRPHWLT